MKRNLCCRWAEWHGDGKHNIACKKYMWDYRHEPDRVVKERKRCAARWHDHAYVAKQREYRGERIDHFRLYQRDYKRRYRGTTHHTNSGQFVRGNIPWNKGLFRRN